MEEADLEPLLGRLSKNVTDLEAVLSPLTKEALSEKAKQLPLVDRAKLYALVVYTIESLIFSYLRLHGVKATEHPVFRELTRVKQYFEKIKLAETGPEKPNMQLDKAAANRFIKHALASNKAGKASEEHAEDSKLPPSEPQGIVTPQKRRFSEDESEDVAVAPPGSEGKSAEQSSPKTSKKKRNHSNGKKKKAGKG